MESRELQAQADSSVPETSIDIGTVHHASKTRTGLIKFSLSAQKFPAERSAHLIELIREIQFPSFPFFFEIIYAALLLSFEI
jgi:hypothetical protein